MPSGTVRHCTSRPDRTNERRSNASISHFIDHKLELENMLGATNLPLTVLVDAKGVVLAKVSGAKAWDGAEARQFIVQTLRLGKVGPAGK